MCAGYLHICTKGLILPHLSEKSPHSGGWVFYLCRDCRNRPRYSCEGVHSCTVKEWLASQKDNYWNIYKIVLEMKYVLQHVHFLIHFSGVAQKVIAKLWHLSEMPYVEGLLQKEGRSLVSAIILLCAEHKKIFFWHHSFVWIWGWFCFPFSHEV